MRIVLDTSTLIAAIRSTTGASKAVVDIALAGGITLLMNYPLACEYRSVAFRGTHLLASGCSQRDLELLIRQLEEIAEPVEVVKSYRPMSPDPDDDLVLDLAINGRADAIVTSNIRHMEEPARQFNIPVLDARAVLSKLR